jgi:hypothetical protein
LELEEEEEGGAADDLVLLEEEEGGATGLGEAASKKEGETVCACD